MSSTCVLLTLTEYEQGEEEPSVLQPCTSPLLSGQSADHRLATQKTAQFLREAERSRRQ